jgi:prepilin-type processing-associated H-X9-DG protein
MNNTTVAAGSAQPNGFQMAFCDGSAQMMSYTIDVETHRRLGNRQDGLAIDGKKF